MDINRRNEGRVILVISLSSIVLWLIISVSTFKGATLFDSLNSNLIHLHFFCEHEHTYLLGETAETCAIFHHIKTRTAIIFSFLFTVYGLLVFLGHAPGLTELWSKFRGRQSES